MSMVAGSPEARAAEAVIILGLVPPFTLDQARARYRELAKIYHPDAGRFADGATFKRLTEALRVIEEHADLVSRSTLSWHTGHAASRTSARLLEELNQAQQALIEKDSEISRLVMENRHLTRLAAEARSRCSGLSPLLYLFPISVLLLAAVSIGTILLRSKDGQVIALGEPVRLTIPAQEVVCDGSGSGTGWEKTSLRVRLTTGTVELTTASLHIRDNKAFVVAHEQTPVELPTAIPAGPVTTRVELRNVAVSMKPTRLIEYRPTGIHNVVRFTSGTIIIPSATADVRDGLISNVTVNGSQLEAEPVINLLRPGEPLPPL